MLALVFSSSTVALAGPIQSNPALQNKEWIAIVPSTAVSQVTPLRNYRISQGRSACIWTIDDLVSSYGSATPTAIRTALQEAWSTWSVKPRWVCIFADHRAGEAFNYAAGRIGDFGLPNAELGRWEPYIRGMLPLMDMDGDSLADIAVGRVPAWNPVLVSNYVSKVIQHDTDVNGRLKYRDSAMLVEDQDVAGNDGYWVKHLADSLYMNWDVSPNQQLIHYSAMGCCLAPQRQAAINAWNAGPGMMLAMGNGSNWLELVGFWETCATTNGFSVGDLSASGNYPALLALSCGVNATDQPVASSCDPSGVSALSEQLLCRESNKGASVIIAPMRNTIQYWDFFIGKHLLIRKAANDYTWGEVLVNGLRSAMVEDPSAYDHVYQFTLEGDPAAQANPGDVVGVEPQVPALTALGQPFPSPTSVGARIQFDLARRSLVELSVCDVTGRRVRAMRFGQMDPGRHTQTWDALTDTGERVGPGVYFVRLRVDGETFKNRIVVVR